MKMIRKIAVMLVWMLSSIYVFGEDGKFTVSVNPPSVSVGEQFQLTFTLNGSGKNFKAPPFPDFNVLMGPSQSTQMQIYNGSVTQSQSFTYILQAVKDGTFRIGSAEILSGNTKLTTNPVTVVVTKGASKPSKPSNPSARGSQGGQGGQSGQTDAQAYDGKNVFIVAQANKTTAYRGEGISVTYKLYTKVNLLNYAVDKLPSLSGFWSQDVQMPQQLDFHNENYDGINYRVAEIKKVVLFPQRSGGLTIDPMEAEVIARIQVKKQRSNDPFDQFFNDPFFNNPFFNNNVQDIKLKLKSDPIHITAKELPDGAPASFSGAVGTFGIDASLDKKETKANEPLTLKLRISGKGNIKLVDAPKVEFPPDFETYDPKENVSINATSSGVSGTKTFEYLLIPRNSGEFKIMVSPFSYFDLDKKAYKEVSGQEFVVKIDKGNAQPTVVSGVIQSDVQLLGKDIRFIKTKEPDFRSTSTPLFLSPLFNLTAGLPFALLFILILVRRKQKDNEANSGLIKSQRATKVALKRLSKAKEFLSQNKSGEFLDEMFRALWGFVSDKLRIPVADLSKENVSSALTEKKVPDELIKQFLETIDQCEFARFAGSQSGSYNELYDKGIDIITKLEHQIKA